jgi:hypothetical protein
MILDYEDYITINQNNPPIQNLQQYHDLKEGMFYLAQIVRSYEIKNKKEGCIFSLSVYDEFPASFFHWFANSAYNFLRLIATLKLMTINNWTVSDLNQKENIKLINKSSEKFVREIIPEIYVYRNKVSGHFAITTPHEKDSIATLESTVMLGYTFQKPYYFAVLQWSNENTITKIPSWSLTKEFEKLSKRFFPELKISEI